MPHLTPELLPEQCFDIGFVIDNENSDGHGENPPGDGCSPRPASVRQASGQTSVRKASESPVVKIATNARRFSPQTPVDEHLSDLTFTGSNWSSQRGSTDSC